MRRRPGGAPTVYVVAGTPDVQSAALGVRAEGNLGPAESASLERAIRDCPPELLPDFLLLKGHVLSQSAATRQDLIRATWPFLRIVAHMPDDPRAAEGLLETAVLLGRIGNRDKAAALLAECLAHAGARAETRRRAEEVIKELEDASSF